MIKHTAISRKASFEKDLPRMPDGYYSGDKPNPNLRAFVEQHRRERPYHPETDDYVVPAFDKTYRDYQSHRTI